MKCIHTSTGRYAKLFFPYQGGYYSFSADQIIRLKSDSNYTYIYTTVAKPIIMAKVLAAYEMMLYPLGFIRPNRSHLINVLHIQHVDSQGCITMKDLARLDISRRKKKEIYRVIEGRTKAAINES
jgi:two-component system LytT family response regulator